MTTYRKVKMATADLFLCLRKVFLLSLLLKWGFHSLWSCKVHTVMGEWTGPYSTLCITSWFVKQASNAKYLLLMHELQRAQSHSGLSFWCWQLPKHLVNWINVIWSQKEIKMELYKAKYLVLLFIVEKLYKNMSQINM